MVTNFVGHSIFSSELSISIMNATMHYECAIVDKGLNTNGTNCWIDLPFGFGLCNVAVLFCFVFCLFVCLLVCFNCRWAVQCGSFQFWVRKIKCAKILRRQRGDGHSCSFLHHWVYVSLSLFIHLHSGWIRTCGWTRWTRTPRRRGNPD